MSLLGTLDEQDPRFRVAAARRILARGGCESPANPGGHVSLRDGDSGSFWASSFGFFDETTPDDVARADLDLRTLAGAPGSPPVLDTSLVEGSLRVSPALEFHAALFRARPDVQSVIHIHAHWTALAGSKGDMIGMYNVNSVVLHEEQALFEDDGTRPPVEGYRVAEALGTRSVLLLKNHGAIVVGDSLERATAITLMLESAAQFHVEAQMFGGTETPIAEVERAKKSYEVHVIPELWNANYRRLRISDPELFAYLGS